MIYIERAPSPILRPSVRSVWYCRAGHLAHARERVLPNGCMQIVINLCGDSLTNCDEDPGAEGRIAGAIVCGARMRYEVIDTRDLRELAGIVLEPGGFPALFRERADLLFERSIALADLWSSPDIIERLCEAPSPAQKLTVLDTLLTMLLRRCPPRSQLVDHAIESLRTEGLSVRDCAASVGVSARRFSQVFREEVGLGPKAWSRLQRFQLAARALHNRREIRWADLALQCGYYDQSHFANDFKAFSGVDPTTYCARRGFWQNHVALP